MERKTKEERDAYNAKLDNCVTESRTLDPSDRAWLARFLLDSLDDIDFDYANFEAAKSVRRHVKAASNELKGLNL